LFIATIPAAQTTLRNQSTPNSFFSESRQRMVKLEDTFHMLSPIGSFFLFNMLIINRLNRQKIEKCLFGVLFSFSFTLKSFILLIY